MMGHTLRRPPAFTLLEILGVLGILAIFLSLTLPVLQKSRAQAKNSRTKSDIQKIESALNLYKMDYGITPTPAEAPGLLSSGTGGDLNILNATSAGPLSPSTKEPYLTIPASVMDTNTRRFLDPWKTPYAIRPTASHNQGDFDIFSFGPDKTKSTQDDVNNWSR